MKQKSLAAKLLTALRSEGPEFAIQRGVQWIHWNIPGMHRLYVTLQQIYQETIWLSVYRLNPRVQTHIPGATWEALIANLEQEGVEVQRIRVDPQEYESYLARADYSPGQYGAYFAEKTLEHFLSFKYLDFVKDDIFIDIASQNSPFPDIVRRLVGCEVYRQDLAYPEGITGDRIGGNAANLPLPENFATKLTLHCSFEHFEGESDTGFIREAARILRPGGMMCIIPLYLGDSYYILSNPFSERMDVSFDEGAMVCHVRGPWGRFGRHYDVEAFRRRVLDHCQLFDLKILFVENPEIIDPRCYVRFIALFQKRS